MPSHVLLLSSPAMGHVRPILGFACRLAIKWQSQRLDSLVITIPVCGEYKRLAEQEIDRYLTDNTLKENIHVISLGGDGKNVSQLFPIFLQNFEAFYTSLRSLEPIKCATGPIHAFTRAPDVVVAGFFLLDCLYSIRKVNQREVPVVSFISAALSVMRLIGPEALGGLGDIGAKAKALAAETGKSLQEAELDVYHTQAGEVIKVPGMPLMYDYEYYPQKSRSDMSGIQIPAFKKAFKMLHECDGMVLSSSTAFDLEGCKTVKAWAAETNRPVYAIGPLIPDELFHTTRKDGSDKPMSGQEVIDFMDQIYESHGACSLLYVSFGTLFWPQGDSIWHVLEYILDSKIPLLFAYDEPRLGKMPEYISEKFKASDRALTSLWTPQQTVLGHSCTGWFMTHCGHNSILEAIAQGVPMLAWPIAGEQPGNAAHISLTLNIAYEIVEGRTELGLKPMYRGVQPTGTLEALKEEIQMIFENAFGEDGKLKRKNVLALKDKMWAGLREGGDSSNDFEMFIRNYLSAV